MQRPETVYGQKVTVAGTEGQANNGGAGHVRHLVVGHGPDTGFYVEVESDLECFEQSVYINDVHVNKKQMQAQVPQQRAGWVGQI